MKTIVAVDKNWGIGKNNDLLFCLKEDMKYFKQMTLNKVIVMGSNTLLSFPGSKPLKDRINIVLYPGGHRDDCIVAQSLKELSQILRNYNSDDIFIVGGAMFYRTMLPYCDTAYITKVNADGNATHFFENLDLDQDWECVDEGQPLMDNGKEIRFTVYRNNNVKDFLITEE
ncbi:MAG: dihydrofolate reductase [Christensenellales bacterium]|jgi:dihydrofolate reductase|nr:dihydrofolate reductase [Clostridiales bacterium]